MFQTGLVLEYCSTLFLFPNLLQFNKFASLVKAIIAGMYIYEPDVSKGNCQAVIGSDSTGVLHGLVSSHINPFKAETTFV